MCGCVDVCMYVSVCVCACVFGCIPQCRDTSILAYAVPDFILAGFPVPTLPMDRPSLHSGLYCPCAPGDRGQCVCGTGICGGPGSSSVASGVDVQHMQVPWCILIGRLH